MLRECRDGEGSVLRATWPGFGLSSGVGPSRLSLTAACLVLAALAAGCSTEFPAGPSERTDDADVSDSDGGAAAGGFEPERSDVRVGPGDASALTDGGLAADARAEPRGRDAQTTPGRDAEAPLEPDATSPPRDGGVVGDAWVAPRDAAAPADAAPPPGVDAAVPPRCPPSPEWAVAPGGFCVSIRDVPVPPEWTGQWSHSATRMPDGTVIVAGGADAEGALATTWRFRPGEAGRDDELVALPALNRGKQAHADVLRRDGALLLFMGDKESFVGGFGEAPDNRTHRWDGAEGAWLENPPDKNRDERSHTAAVQLPEPDGRIVVAGGHGEVERHVHGVMDTVQVFEADQWTDAPGLGTARAGHGLIGLPAPGLRVMAFGGFGTDGPVFAPEVIDFAAPDPIWQPVDHDVDGAGHGFAAVATAADGRVYVTGGLGPGGAPTALCLRFDPATMRWTRLPDLPRAVAGHTLTPLADGRLVLIGGANPAAGGAVDRVWVLVPGRGWSESRRLGAARRHHTANALGEGRILVVGGFDDDRGGPVPEVEIHTLGR